jgi:hypothetical protein
MSSRTATRVAKLFREMEKSPGHKFPEKGGRVAAPNRPGVYVIADPRRKVVHVGRTLRRKRGLAQRLKDHLYARSSFTIQYLKKRGDRLRGKFSYRYLEIPDDRIRAFVEAYAIGHLCPAHIGLGRKVKHTRSKKR